MIYYPFLKTSASLKFGEERDEEEIEVTFRYLISYVYRIKYYVSV